jgi:D-sedoheptulose 7-phosphate isomerase
MVEDRIRYLFGESIQSKIAVADLLCTPVARASGYLAKSLLNNGKLFLCGHGGSAANALHFSNAMMNHFERERPSLPVITLTTDSAILSGFGLEGHFDQVFSRQIQALGQAGDVLLTLSTSGNAMSLLNAVHAAHDRGMDVIALNGRDGGMLANHLGPEDIELRVPGTSAAHIREIHLFILHCFCDLIEQSLFG